MFLGMSGRVLLCKMHQPNVMDSYRFGDRTFQNQHLLVVSHATILIFRYIKSHINENCLIRFNVQHKMFISQESTGHRDIGYQCTVHDLKLLLMRFAREKQFHEDTGGGGPLSNMQLVPCLMHMALYVINT